MASRIRDFATEAMETTPVALEWTKQMIPGSRLQIVPLFPWR
jgi:hypothetical protein